jgi:cytochrome oxidase Cu insertion factor (SCO1/SenC/PrrC family)
MNGMHLGGFDLTNALAVSLFHHAVFVSAVVWIIGIAVAILAVTALRKKIPTFNLSMVGLSESRARTYLRLSFGAIWIIDGVLQLQTAMPLGMANQVVKPMTASTPTWLHALMNAGIGIWNMHPIALAVGTAWIQLGLGLVLMVSNGATGRVVGLVSAGWASMIWLIGNGAGGIFQGTNSLLFGWPGATIFYVIAGLFIAANPETFRRRFSPFVMRTVAVIMGLAAVLQALPDREFWHGGNSNALTAMATSMTQIPQPHALAWIVRQVGTLAGTLGGGFNLIVIAWMAATAVGLWRVGATKSRWPVLSLVVGALFFWVVAEDAAIFGGLATDLNSLVPLAVLVWCASPALSERSDVTRRLPEEFRSGTGSVVAAFGVAMILFSVVTMSMATVSPAETTLYLAVNGNAAEVSAHAPAFSLVDQHGAPYVLGEHAHRFTLLTFLDPRCWTDCPLLAAQLKTVRASLGANAKIDIVAVAADPYFESQHWLNVFIAKHELGSMKNFYYVTGRLHTMQAVWRSYGIGVEMTKGDKMSIHSDYMFIITPAHRLKWIIPDDPLASYSGTQSASQEILHLLATLGVH